MWRQLLGMLNERRTLRTRGFSQLAVFICAGQRPSRVLPVRRDRT